MLLQIALLVFRNNCGRAPEPDADYRDILRAFLGFAHLTK